VCRDLAAGITTHRTATGCAAPRRGGRDIGIYSGAIALARPSLNGFRSSGATLPVISVVVGVVAIFA
jgi:hypothetical protein